VGETKTNPERPKVSGTRTEARPPNEKEGGGPLGDLKNLAEETAEEAVAQLGAPSKVKSQYSDLVEEPEKYKESRVRLKNFTGIPGAPSYGGFPNNPYSYVNPDTQIKLLVPVPSVDPNKQQYLHVLAAKRLKLLNEKWQKDHPTKEELKLCSGFRPNRFPKGSQIKNPKSYHLFCKGKGYWLPNMSPWGPGAASPSAMGLTGSLDQSKRCNKWIAYYSPHETGLAMDFGNHGLTASSQVKGQKETPLFKWLQQNAHLFGITPLLHEAWHWEVNVPVEAWRTGEEFVEGDDYAVRVKGDGKRGDIIQSAGGTGVGNPSQTPPCPPTSLLGGEEEKKRVLPDLRTFSVQEPKYGADPGVKFKGLRERSLDSIVNIVIHDTAGFWNTVEAPPGVGKNGKSKERLCIAVLAEKGASVHFTIGRGGGVRQHADLKERCGHISGRINPISIGLEFINPISLTKDKAKKFAKQTLGKNALEMHPIIEKGNIWPGGGAKPYFIANTFYACKALYELIDKIIKSEHCKNLRHEYPCTEGGALYHKDDRHRQPGIFAHRREQTNRTDGMFGEYYCARKKLHPDESYAECWYQTMSVFIEKSKGSDPKAGYPDPKTYKKDGAKKFVEDELNRVAKLLVGEDKPEAETPPAEPPPETPAEPPAE